ncbi:MAG: hypothetical protein PHX83_03260 [Acidobacteriia bacterium]|nr:hypothetical protein [Terriglobia bacterium]
MNSPQEIIQTLDRIITEAEFRGYDPYDVLNGPLFLWMAHHSKWSGVILTQAFRYFPFNLRPILRIPPTTNAKTMALLARAYLRLHQFSPDAGYLRKAQTCLTWLDEHRSSGFENACWGYSFPWCTVRQFLERNVPSTVCSAFVAHAFLDAYELIGESRYLKVARSVCDFIQTDVARIPGAGGFCFSYSPVAALPVHNANLLAVSVLGRSYRHTGEKELLEGATPALEYTLRDQNEDGSWYYHGPYAGRDGTIDNFHTGFVLECLRQFQHDTGKDVQQAVDQGQMFYEQRLFDAGGAPRRKIGMAYPVDIRDPAEFMAMMGRMERLSADQNSLLAKVFRWTVKEMRNPGGYFYSLRWRVWRYSPMYLRWQAWMLWAMSNLLTHSEDLKI